MASTSKQAVDDLKAEQAKAEAQALAEYQRKYKKLPAKVQVKVERKGREFETIGIQGLSLGKPPLILPSNMGVKPGPADLRNGLAHPSFGPPRADFTGDDLQNFYVSSVTGPARFCVKNTEQKGALKEMEAAMTKFYDDYWKHHPKMRKDDLVLGGFYACYSEEFETWNRCRLEDFMMNQDVVKKGNDTSLAIQLLDYGTWEIVTNNEIYPLRPEFLELPCQVAVATLYDNNDSLEEWTRVDNKEFISAVGGKVVRGYVVSCKEIPTEVFSRVELVLVNNGKVLGDGFFMYADRLDLNKSTSTIRMI